MKQEDIKEFLDRMTGPDIVREVEYPVFTPPLLSDNMKVGIGFIDDIQVTITAELGRTTMKIRDILKLSEGSIVELEQPAGETAEVLINEQKMGKCEIIVIGSSFGIRIESIMQKEKKESIGKQ